VTRFVTALVGIGVSNVTMAWSLLVLGLQQKKLVVTKVTFRKFVGVMARLRAVTAGLMCDGSALIDTFDGEVRIVATATKLSVVRKVGDFTVESLGVEYPDYFQGYGLGPNSKYDFCAYGVGDTEEEALADCLEQVAQQGFDLDEETEERVRADFGAIDDSTTAAEELGLADDEVDEEFNAYWHVGIKWNCREEERLKRIRKIRGLQFCQYEDYRPLERDSSGYGKTWGYATRADGDVSYGDLKDADRPESAEKYLEALSTDILDSGELYFYVPYATGSDMSGDTVTAANYKVFIETYKEDWVHAVHGGFNTYAAVIGLTGLLGCAEDTFDEVCNVLEGLEDYPFIDEEAHSRLEMEKTDEAWESGYAADFRDALEKKFDGAEFAWPSDGDLRTFFEDKREKANVYWENEGSGADMIVRLERIVEGINLDDVEKWAICYKVSFVDCGLETEEFGKESEAIERVAQLRESGSFGAFYSVITPGEK